MRYHVLFSGGLGDIIWSYFTDWHWLRYPIIKSKFPELNLDLIISSHNSHSIEFFRFCPYFDRLYTHEYGTELLTETKHLAALSLAEFDSVEMPTFLSFEEKCLIAKIKKPYFVIHPFAGDSHRSFVNLVDFKALAGVLSCNIVILGGNHIRFGQECVENLDLKHPNIYNFVGKTNARVSVEIIRQSSGFIGTHSCYLMAAWALNVKTLCIAPDDLLCYLYNPGNIATPYIDYLFKNNNILVLFSQLPFIDRFLSKFLQSS